MEKNLISMAPEIETLQAELLNAERRGRRFGCCRIRTLLVYCTSRNPDMRCANAGGAFDDNYSGAWGIYDTAQC
ncbi:hypothetical protein Patl1_16443 [Pistacia atlantica]|uniref:Uncharacterized protein n=1 Tax=Pistacia atlantica TaxID=434234 RepID=A0ACC1BAS1_9ROSI|nr:hypothetical protein Patl1_16443 [Pistacia atlantica]